MISESNIMCWWWQCEREFHVGCLKEQGLADLTVSFSLCHLSTCTGVKNI
jgi:hypothetical protein